MSASTDADGRWTCCGCGKPIAAALTTEAFCCECRYGKMTDRLGAPIKDAIDLMRLNHNRFKSATGEWSSDDRRERDPMEELAYEYDRIDAFEQKMKRKMESEKENGN